MYLTHIFVIFSSLSDRKNGVFNLLRPEANELVSFLHTRILSTDGQTEMSVLDTFMKVESLKDFSEAKYTATITEDEEGILYRHPSVSSPLLDLFSSEEDKKKSGKDYKNALYGKEAMVRSSFLTHGTAIKQDPNRQTTELLIRTPVGTTLNNDHFNEGLDHGQLVTNVFIVEEKAGGYVTYHHYAWWRAVVSGTEKIIFGKAKATPDYQTKLISALDSIHFRSPKNEGADN